MTPVSEVKSCAVVLQAKGPAAVAALQTPLPSAVQTAPSAIASGVVAPTRRRLGSAVAPAVHVRPASSVSKSCEDGSSTSTVVTIATAWAGLAGSATMRSTCPPGVGPDGDQGAGAAVAATGVRARAAAVAARTRARMA